MAPFDGTVVLFFGQVLLMHYCLGQISQRPCNSRCLLNVNYSLGIDSPADLSHQWPLLKAKNDSKV